MGGHILVVDPDARAVLLVSTALEQLQYTVETARDGEEALTKINARMPALVVSEVKMPVLDGWGLLRALRAKPKTARVPVMFVTSQTSDDDRMKGYRLGAEDYMAKPFRAEELALRVARCLRRGGTDNSEGSVGEPCLHGDLSQLNISTLFVLLEMEKKTGLLTCTALHGEAVEVLLREGRIVHARVRDQRDPVDANCVFYLLTWSSGSFEFALCQIEGADRINEPTTALLMEGARLLDESREAMTEMPEISTDVLVVEDEAEPNVDDEWSH